LKDIKGFAILLVSDIKDDSSLVKTKKEYDVFKEAVNRIKEVTGKKTQKDLCEEIGIAPRNYRAREEKGEFDANWAYRVGVKYKISIDWLLTGKGSKRHFEATTNKYAVKLGQWIDEYSKDDPRRAGLAEIKIEEALPEFREWLEAKDTKAKAA